jgi:hypothetical protein
MDFVVREGSGNYGNVVGTQKIIVGTHLECGVGKYDGSGKFGVREIFGKLFRRIRDVNFNCRDALGVCSGEF